MMKSNRLLLNKKKINSKKSGFVKKFILILIIIFCVFFTYFYYNLNSGIILISKEINVKKGDDINNIFSGLKLSESQIFFMKLYIRFNEIKNIKIMPGIYVFSGTYSKENFLQVLNAGPVERQFRLIIFEGNNIYDVDQKLSAQGLIEKGEYISLATDPEIFVKYKNKYEFLKYIPNNKITLEGFLYPDTYQLPSEGNIADRLIYLQLEAFQQKIWTKYRNKFLNFDAKLKSNEFKINMNIYDIIILASIIEKEEKKSENKFVIAGIFLNRLQNKRRLDSDSSLCYKFFMFGKECTSKTIQANVDDKTNPYNTRAVKGLPPTPIDSPSLDTFLSLLNFDKNEFFYYLHGSDGGFYPARTNDEHNLNIQKYIEN